MFPWRNKKSTNTFQLKKELYLQLCDDNDDFGFDDWDDVCADSVTKEQRNVIFLQKFC